MSKITVKQAALLTGKSRETINQATKDGTISFSLNRKKHKVIEVSELEREFELVKTIDEISGQSDDVRDRQNVSDRTDKYDKQLLQQRIRHLEDIAALLNKERLREREQMQEQLDNLQKALERTQEQHSNAMVLLTDQTKERAGDYEQSFNELKDQIANQTEAFDRKLSDVKSEVKEATREEIKSKPWWNLLRHEKLQA